MNLAITVATSHRFTDQRKKTAFLCASHRSLSRLPNFVFAIFPSVRFVRIYAIFHKLCTIYQDLRRTRAPRFLGTARQQDLMPLRGFDDRDNSCAEHRRCVASRSNLSQH